MNNIEEVTKQSQEAHWAILGRAIADELRAGKNVETLVNEAALLRRQEQDSANRETMLAAVTRQIGDARRSGRDVVPLMKQLVALRRNEIDGTPIPAK